MPGLVDVTRAARMPAHHQLVPGVGYVDHGGPPRLPPTANGRKNCAPPAGSKDGSMHKLRPPQGGLVTMVWLNRNGGTWSATRPHAGYRMAWAAAHLQRAGWEYAGAK